MKCSNKAVSELIPWYVTGQLSPEEKEKVEKHLGICTVCRDDFVQMKWISRGVKNQRDGLIPDHIVPEKLVLYAESRSELNKDELAAIESHLEQCKRCQEELQIVNNVNDALRSERKSHWFRTLFNKLEEKIPKFMVKPAFAYIVILLLLYPAWLGIFRELRSFEPSVAGQNYALSPLDTRSELTEENVIKISPPTDEFSLSFTIPILSSEHIRYDAVILNAEKKRIWRKTDIKSIDEYGSFLLICHRRFFKEGAYTLIIQEIDIRRNQKQNEFVFAFKRLGG